MLTKDKKEMKEATRPGGAIGSERQHSVGGTLVHHIGDDWAWRPGRVVSLVVEYSDHIGLLVQVSLTGYRWLVIPKADVVSWGVLERRSVPMVQSRDRSSFVAGALLYGPIGALVGASLDARAADKQGGKPVVGITYRAGLEEHAVFLEFPFSWQYHKVHELLSSCLPEQLRNH